MKKFCKFLIILITLFCSIDKAHAYFTTNGEIVGVFKTKNYSFKINGNGGIFNNETNVVVSDNTVTLPIPIRNGYSFLGFSNSLDGEIDYTNNISDVNKINNNLIYARWEIDNYSISYNLNGGIINNQKTDYTVEDNYILPTPTKEGYTFIGWTGSNGNIPQKIVTIPKGTTGNLNYIANWSINTYVVNVDSIIQNNVYSSGLDGFTFSVWINDSLVAEKITDYSKNVDYGTKIRIQVHDRDGYNITSFKDKTWIITDNLNINPTWYDNISPTITSFSVTNLGLFNPSIGISKGWNIRVYINGYDNGTGIQKYQTWLVPYGEGSGAARKDGNDRILKEVIYLNTVEGRTFCAYAIDNAGNESEKCETIRVN